MNDEQMIINLRIELDDVKKQRDDFKNSFEKVQSENVWLKIANEQLKSTNSLRRHEFEKRLHIENRHNKKISKRLAAKREQYRELEKKHIELTKRHEHTHSLYAATFEESYEVKWRQTEERLKLESDRLKDASENVYQLESKFVRCEEDNERMRDLVDRMRENNRAAIEHDSRIIDNLEKEVKELQLDIVGLVRKNRKEN